MRSYFDPVFSKYFASFIILLFVIGIAWIFVLVFFLLRAIIDQKFHKAILLSIICLINAFLGAFLFYTLSKSSTVHSHLLNTNIIDSRRIFKGYNLDNGELSDEKGGIIKRWPDSKLDVIDKNGDYYAQRNGLDPKNSTWGRYTWDDKMIWEKHFLIHHELYLSPKGTIFTFSTDLHNYNDYKVDFDVILEYDKNGKELQRYSFWDHLKDFQPYHAKFGIDVSSPIILTPLMFLWHQIFYSVARGADYDYFHLNSFFMIPPNALEGKNPAFRPGNWLISIFHGSMVFILDQDTKKILWHAVANEIEGSLEGQHSASMLPDGNILLFENGVTRQVSRILIIDPLTLKIKWQYRNKNFFTSNRGFVQALPNGNFLVTESNKGHVFELTPDKEIVWDYMNNQGEIYRMTRYPKEMIDRLLTQ